METGLHRAGLFFSLPPIKNLQQEEGVCAVSEAGAQPD